MKWQSLTQDQLTRLAECRSIKADIVPIAKAYMLERGYDPDYALITTLEHLDANGQYYDPTRDEYNNWLYELNIYHERQTEV